MALVRDPNDPSHEVLRQILSFLGPEVIAEAIKVLEAIFVGSSEVELKLETHPFGGCAIDELGEALPASTLQACKEADAILMGKSRTHPPPPDHKKTTFRPARLHRRPQMGRQQQSAPRAGPARPAQGARPLRQHPPGELRVRLAARQLAAQGVRHAGREHHRRARAHRRRLLWRAQGAGRRARRARRLGHDDLQRRGGPAHHARRRADRTRVQPAAPDPLDRQGERPRELPPLEEGRDRDPEQRVPADQARSPARRLGRNAHRLRSTEAQWCGADGKSIRGHVSRCKASCR